jgi:D-glycero-beta-D-manno-heptose 1-phosphate adenylyltransferase
MCESSFSKLQKRQRLYIAYIVVALARDKIGWTLDAKWFRAGESLGRVVTQDELMSRVAEAKAARRRIVFTNGCFDLLHPGHTRLLEKSRELGDVLILALNSDRSVRENKGADRPIISEVERAEVAAALAAVDHVVLFDEATPREIITRVLPDVLVKGGDWGPNEIVGREEVEAAGGQVVSIPFEPGYSTSSIIERVLKIPS